MLFALLLLASVATLAAALPPSNYVYGVASQGTATYSSYYSCIVQLVRWDTLLNSVALIGPLPNCTGWVGMHAPSGGTLYSCADIGYLCTVDPTTAVATTVCPGLALPGVGFGTALAMHPITGILYFAIGGNTVSIDVIAVDPIACSATNVGSTSNGGAKEGFSGNMVGNRFFFFNYSSNFLYSFDVTDPTLTLSRGPSVAPPLNVGDCSGGGALFNLCDPHLGPSAFLGMQIFIARTTVLNQTGGVNACDGSLSTTPFTVATTGLPPNSIFGSCAGTAPTCYHPWSMTSACFPASLPSTCPTTTSTSTLTTAAPATTLPGIPESDRSAPRVGLYFQSTVAAGVLLTGVQFYSLSATQAVVVEAFNSSKSLVASHSLPAGTGITDAYATVMFATPVAVVVNTTYYVSFSALQRAQTFYFYGANQTVGNAVYINSWYQYPPFTNPVITKTYLNSNYYVYPVLQ